MGRKEASFGRVVKDLRRALKLTQTELARRVACATITIRKVEADGMHPSWQIVERLAMALDVSPQERPRFAQLARATALADSSPVPLPTPTPAPEEIGLPNLSGRAIRGYELGERLGTGGFGVVYRAVQPLVEREVAIKIVLPQYADHPDFIRRFEAEAQLVARLEHPYIVPLYDYWREPGVAYLVMRLLRGGSLEEKVRAGPLALETVAVLLEQIGAALHAAHRQGVVHRDLKPANVLLDEDGNGYLADFGIAKDLGAAERTQVGTIVASPAYASPEQIRSEEVQPQADIYGLGVLLYELLAGEKPFPGPTPIDYIQQHLSNPLPSLAVQPALDPLLRRATAKDPAERYPDVPSLLADFRQALAGRPLRAVPYALAGAGEELENPYKGLRAFTEADADDFFGRETLVQELLGRLAVADEEEGAEPRELGRFLAVVGPSGCGKSSVVKAGLIPALRRGALPGSERWFIVDMQPGAHPFAELEAALLRVAVSPPEGLLALLQEGERGLLRAVRRVLPADPGVELVLVIDQFEELFTQVADEGERAAFITALVTAVVDPQSRVRVVVTLRADFTDRPLQYVDLGELVRQRAVFVLPLTAEELEEAIVRPAARVGLALEEGLEAAIIQDVGEEPGMLPLLQYTLTELFERRAGRMLTLAAYHEIGGVSGALARRAEELYAGLGEGEQEAARQLFLRLVTLGEGSEDTRRRVLQSEVEALGEETGGRREEAGSRKQDTRSRMQEVIGVFGRHRLLTFDRDPLTRGPTVEVAHEALLREWARLRGWLEESRGDVRLQRLLAAAAGEWESAGREPSYLLGGARLAQFTGWAEGSRVALTAGEREYLAASVAARVEEEAAEKARRKEELATALQLAETEKARAEAEKQRAEEQGRNARRLRQRALWLAGALAVAAVLAALALFFGQAANNSAQEAGRNLNAAQTAQAQAVAEAGVRATAQAVAVAEADVRATAQAVAVTQQAVAEEEAHARATAEAEALASLNHSEALRLAGEANRLLLKQGDSELVALLALRSLRLEYTPGGDEALEGATQLDYPLRIFTRYLEAVYAVSFSPDGRYIVSGGNDPTLRLWDASTGEEVRQFNGHTGLVYTVAFSPDGRFIASASADGTARLWDIAGGAEIRQLIHPAEVAGCDFSPDGRYLVTGDAEGTVRLWDTTSGAEVRALMGHTGRVNDVTFSPDGRFVLSGSDDNTAQLWDARTGEPLRTFSGHTNVVRTVDFFPDGQDILTASADRTVRRWDVVSGQEVQRFTTSDFADAKVSPDGQLVLAGDAAACYLWNASTGVLVRRFVAPSLGIAFSPDGRYVAIGTGAGDGAVRLWEVAPQGGLPRFPTMDGALVTVSFSPDGRTLLAAVWSDGTARLWDARSGAELQVFRDDNLQQAYAATFSPDGRTVLVTGCCDGMARLWDVRTGQELRAFPTGMADMLNNAFSPDGRYVVTVGTDPRAIVWDVTTGERHLVIDMPLYAEHVAYSPDGATILTSSYDGQARLWDAETGEPVRVFAVDESIYGELEGIAFSPDGRYVAAGDCIGTLWLWDAANGAEVRRFTGHAGCITRVAFSPDGQTIATVGWDLTVRLWDAASGREMRRLVGHKDTPYGVAFSPDGQTAATASWDGTIRLWYADINDTIDYICGRLLRDLTSEEREQYGITDETPTCPLTVSR